MFPTDEVGPMIIYWYHVVGWIRLQLGEYFDINLIFLHLSSLKMYEKSVVRPHVNEAWYLVSLDKTFPLSYLPVTNTQIPTKEQYHSYPWFTYVKRGLFILYLKLKL